MLPAPPRLWIVATPLGNIDDFSPRARAVLADCDCILAEDTRRAQRLCAACALSPKRLLSFFDHNEDERLSDVLSWLRQGQHIALISDAGTPLLADPGYRLVRACRLEGLPVSPVPGPSAPVCALQASGLPPLPYSFLGFLPRETQAKRRLFLSFSALPGSLVFFERADRLVNSLTLAFEVLGSRELAVCRELTKTYEEFILTRLENVNTLSGLLGELTLVIGPSDVRVRSDTSLVREALAKALRTEGKVKAAVRCVQASVNGWSGKELYALAEELKSMS